MDPASLFGFGIEKQLTAGSSVSANYVGTRGVHLFRSIDANAPLPPGFSKRPDPALGQDRQIQSEGSLEAESLELGFRGRLGGYFQGQAQYTLGKIYNNTSGITYFAANSYAPDADWSRSDNDRRNKFDLLGTFTAKSWFDFGTALSLYSGKPVDVTTGNDENRDSLALDRPPGVSRNSLHGPGYIDLDFNLSHTFLLTKSGKEGPRARLGVNSFNVLNHENDTTYIGVVSSPLFGRAMAAQPPRRMQLDVQLVFRYGIDNILNRVHCHVI